MKIAAQKKRAGFTLVEMMMSVGCGSLILAAVLAAGVSLQRSFAAVEAYSTAEGDQLRVLDYIAMDCRRATSASVTNNTLILTLPVYYNVSNSNAPVQPTLSSGALSYGSGGVTIKYSQSGSNFNREVISQNSDGTTSDVTTAIATNVATFTVTSQDLTSSVSCSVFFFPTFTRMPGSGTWRSGSSTPSNGSGVDGDYYVINTTASDSTTVGNVYYRSSGSYSLLQNIKATIVYCNTFLRNASARQ